MANYQDCAADGCDKRGHLKGFCKAHYARFKRHGDPLAGRAPGATAPPQFCSVRGCRNGISAKGVCEKHLTQWTALGQGLVTGPRLYTPKQTKRIDPVTGYVMWSDFQHPAKSGNSSIVLEHRAVMVEKLGRPLRPGETVHHINGVRTDNRPENLELWVTLQPAGQRPTDLIAYAREIIARYGSEAA